MSSAMERLVRRLDRTDPNACWPYQSTYRNRSGHTQIWDQGRMRNVHRVAWEATNGPIPDDLCVLHRCDNPPCCNPRHLFLGTVADNNRDRDEKGRHVPLPGSRNGAAKLIEADVVEIRAALIAGVRHPVLARRFGVSTSLISLIKRRKAWMHV